VLQVAREIHTLMQDANDIDSVLADPEENHVSLRRISAIAGADVLARSTQSRVGGNAFNCLP
jgi:hypothetical protein